MCGCTLSIGADAAWSARCSIRLIGAPARRVPAGDPSTQGALVVASTLSPPAGVTLADACIAPDGSAVMARTSTGALLMIALGAARPSGPPAAAGPPSTAELDSPTLPTYPAPADDQAVADARASLQEAAGAAEAGPLACESRSGDAAAGSQAGAGPAADGVFSGAGEGTVAFQPGSAEDRPSEAAGGTMAGSGPSAQGPDATEDLEDRAPWEIGGQAWALVAAPGMDAGAGWSSGSGRAFQPLPTAFHAGGVVAVSAAEHQPLLATLGSDNVLR